jgi:hypothetical protein
MKYRHILVAFATAFVITGAVLLLGQTPGGNVPATPPFAPLNSPALTGAPTSPTPTGTDNSTKIATTAFVKGQSSGTGSCTNQVVTAVNAGAAPTCASVTPALLAVNSYVTSAYTNSTTTFSNVTGASFSAAANTKYHFTCDFDYIVSSTSGGAQFQFTGPGSPTGVTSDFWITYSALNSLQVGVQGGFSSSASGQNVGSATAYYPVRTTLTLNNGSNAGTVQLQAALTSANGTLTILTPAACVLTQ